VGPDRVRILAKITPQRGQATGPGSAWPQRGHGPPPDVLALDGVVVTLVKERW